MALPQEKGRYLIEAQGLVKKHCLRQLKILLEKVLLLQNADEARRGEMNQPHIA